MDFVPLLLLPNLSIPPFLPAEMKPERKEEEGEMTVEEEDEGKIPKEEPAQLENGENTEDNESGSTDSGQENSGEPRLMHSGTYSDRTESKAYSSVTHKCEVRPARPLGCVSGCHWVPLGSGVTVPVPPSLGLWEGVHPHRELQTAHPYPHRREALLVQGVQQGLL